MTIAACLVSMSVWGEVPIENDKWIERNGMKVRWWFEEERLFIEMTAPTEGWVTIGFNEKSSIQGAYLLMGRVQNGVPEVVEHYAIRPGVYRELTELCCPPQVVIDTGIEQVGGTKLRFSIPTHPANDYAKPLRPGQQYTLVLAYSQSDDFQHHSRMRTAVSVTL